MRSWRLYDALHQTANKDRADMRERERGYDAEKQRKREGEREKLEIHVLQEEASLLMRKSASERNMFLSPLLRLCSLTLFV